MVAWRAGAGGSPRPHNNFIHILTKPQRLFLYILQDQKFHRDTPLGIMFYMYGTGFTQRHAIRGYKKKIESINHA